MKNVWRYDEEIDRNASDYRVIEAGDRDSLAEAVNALLAEGYIPAGGVAVWGDDLIQAVYRPIFCKSTATQLTEDDQ